MDILAGLAHVLSDPVLLAWVLAAAVVGMVVGAIPGLTASAAIAMLLPLTFYMEPLPALAFLYVIGKSGRYGGSIAAILFNTPGTAASAATQLDGYPLTRQDAAACVLYASEEAMTVAHQAVQAMGGAGFLNDSPVARIFRDAKLMEIGAGTSEIRRMLIGREMMGAMG